MGVCLEIKENYECKYTLNIEVKIYPTNFFRYLYDMTAETVCK